MSINRDTDKQKQLFSVVFIYREGAGILKMSESGTETIGISFMYTSYHTNLSQKTVRR